MTLISEKKALCIFFKNEELIVSIISSLFVHGKSYLRFRLSSRSVLLIIVVTRIIFHLLSLYIPELNPRTRLTVRPYFTVFLSSVSGDGWGIIETTRGMWAQPLIRLFFLHDFLSWAIISTFSGREWHFNRNISNLTYQPIFYCKKGSKPLDSGGSML